MIEDAVTIKWYYYIWKNKWNTLKIYRQTKHYDVMFLCNCIMINVEITMQSRNIISIMCCEFNILSPWVLSQHNVIKAFIVKNKYECEPNHCVIEIMFLYATIEGVSPFCKI